MNYLNKLVSKLQKSPVDIDEFLLFLKAQNTFFVDAQLEFELLLSNGFPMDIIDNDIVYKPTITNIKDQVFCIVDIETTAGKPSVGQIIELGAVKYKNGQIIDKFDQLVYCKEVPEQIQKVTGISTSMLVDAPELKYVLEDFKLFLQDDIFVAHAIKFDYNFVSDSFKQYNLGELCNAKMCTIDLAKRVIKSEKYGLKFLKEILDIDIQNHHRAYSDALSSSIILEKCLEDLPVDITTSNELLIFSLSDNIINNPKKQKQKQKQKNRN
jgi:DNA polymerase-3 subunit epsilon